MRDAQAGVPSAGWLWAQLAFKNSMVHGILQFTPSIRILLRSSSMREPRYPLPRVVCDSKRPRPTCTPRTGQKLDASFSFVVFLGTYRAGVHVHGSFCFAGFDNDPSAGSPTETLLRLLLPLNDKVQWIFSRRRRRRNRPRRRDPNTSPDHSIGRSDGRCVQRAGT
ncbi:hypothetical protein L2E82_52535 [Cichorium intybus]|nr:hypothetical protein L2E82_52535 [Cichorium intybus]